MSSQDFRYAMRINIQITGTESKKDNVRNAVISTLQNALNAGNIDQATWSISQQLIPEGGTIK